MAGISSFHKSNQFPLHIQNHIHPDPVCSHHHNLHFHSHKSHLHNVIHINWHIHTIPHHILCKFHPHNQHISHDIHTNNYYNHHEESGSCHHTILVVLWFHLHILVNKHHSKESIQLYCILSISPQNNLYKPHDKNKSICSIHQIQYHSHHHILHIQFIQLHPRK